ncbi:MAG: DUF308 domain-containing protein [Lachnospiraceae bacterium]|nr:DUF308 domain-containing protein [Lachnospiraceae bacterium]
MRNVKPMKLAKGGYVVMSIVLMLAGIFLIIFPSWALKAVEVIFAIAMIMFGIIKLVGYFSKDLFRLAFQYDLAFGLLLILLGVIALVKPGDELSLVLIATGIAVLGDGLFKIQIAIDAKEFGIRKWWLIFISAIVTGMIGLVLVFRPAESAVVLAIILGVALLLDGILSLVTVITAVKIVNHQRPDIIDM